MTSITTFRAGIVQETSADVANFNANKSPTDTLTQYFTTNPQNVYSGILTNVQVLIDSANNRSFDFFIAEDADADNQKQQARIIFDSADYPDLGSQGIADNTEETFECFNSFKLFRASRIYFSAYSSAGAFGNCLGRLKIWGIAFI